ncbi:MAG: hypothetical protein V3S55_07735 [Nitrospiraceae bacterium]
MGAHRYVLEVALSTDQRTRFPWPEAIYGAPRLHILKYVVDAHNLTRTREDSGRRPWWWARIVDQGTEEEIVYYDPKMDGIGRRLEK